MERDTLAEQIDFIWKYYRQGGFVYLAVGALVGLILTLFVG